MFITLLKYAALESLLVHFFLQEVKIYQFLRVLGIEYVIPLFNPLDLLFLLKMSCKYHKKISLSKQTQQKSAEENVSNQKRSLLANLFDILDICSVMRFSSS